MPSPETLVGAQQTSGKAEKGRLCDRRPRLADTPHTLPHTSVSIGLRPHPPQSSLFLKTDPKILSMETGLLGYVGMVEGRSLPLTLGHCQEGRPASSGGGAP